VSFPFNAQLLLLLLLLLLLQFAPSSAVPATLHQPFSCMQQRACPVTIQHSALSPLLLLWLLLLLLLLQV
jgi:hypothetical protein